MKEPSHTQPSPSDSPRQVQPAHPPPNPSPAAHQERVRHGDHVDITKQRLGTRGRGVEQRAHVAQQLDVQGARRRLAGLAAAAEQDGGVHQDAALDGIGFGQGGDDVRDGACVRLTRGKGEEAWQRVIVSSTGHGQERLL